MSQPPMIGSWQVLVHAVRPYTIHGDLYYELHITRLDEDSAQGYAVRVPQHCGRKRSPSLAIDWT